jgi:hypothetical protein
MSDAVRESLSVVVFSVFMALGLAGLVVRFVELRDKRKQDLKKPED